MRGEANISGPGEFTITNDSPRRRPIGSISVPGKVDGEPGQVTATLSPRQHLQARSSQDLTVKKATKPKAKGKKKGTEAGGEGEDQGESQSSTSTGQDQGQEQGQASSQGQGQGQGS